MSHHFKSVNPCIGSAGSHATKRRLYKRRKRMIEDRLHSRRVGLHLPTVIFGAIIGQINEISQAILILLLLAMQR